MSSDKPAEQVQLIPLKAYWEDYLERVIKPSGAGRAQIVESEKVFYAGAFAALNEFSKIGHPSISEVVGVQHVQSLDFECKAHARKVIQRHSQSN